MKKKLHIKDLIIAVSCSVVIILILAVVLLLPISKNYYDDGGTITYDAGIYKVVQWERYFPYYGISYYEVYNKTTVYWFPYNYKSLGELWEIEKSNDKDLQEMIERAEAWDKEYFGY